MKAILIVDEDHATRLIYGDELEGEGYRVRTCTDCTGCAISIERQKPDLVLVGVDQNPKEQMPVFRILHKLCPEVPVVLYGLDPWFEDESWDAWGAAGFVQKRPKQFELKNVVGRILGDGLSVPAHS